MHFIPVAVTLNLALHALAWQVHPEIRFFAMTTMRSFAPWGLTIEDPRASQERFQA